MATPRASRTSAPPTVPETDRFPCFATGTPAAATTRPAAVEMLKVEAPSPPVPQVSIAPGGTPGMGSAAARSARAAAVSSSIVSPFVRSATRKAAICAGVASPASTALIAWPISGSVRSWPSTTRAMASRSVRSGSSGSSGGRRSRGQARQEIAEQLLSRERQDRLGVELDALDEQLPVAHSHDRLAVAVGGPRRALEHGRQTRGVDHERVVAGGIERIRQAREDAPVVVVDGRGLAVHDARGADDLAPEGGADRLMAEADTEDRDPSREALDERHRDAGVARGARAGRDDDPVGSERGHLVERDGVVAPDLELRAQLTQVLDQVVGERVVVVDHEELHSASARRTAWTMARALFM